MKNRKWLLTMTGAITACMLFSAAAPAGQVSAEVNNTQAAATAQTEETQTDDKQAEKEKTEETKTEETKAEETKTDATQAEGSQTEKEKTEETKSEDTKTEETKTEESKTEETKAEESKTDAEKADAAKTETAKTDEAKTVDDAEEAKKALQNDPNHAHKFEWVAQMNEFEAAEGTMNYICQECGKIWFFRPIPAYLAFTGSTANKILTAPSGDTVKISTSHFISFNKEVMEALAKRPDVSIYVSFLDGEYKGNRVSFTIPAGEDTVSLLDANGYAGFLYIGGKYGLTMEVPMEVEVTEEKPAEEASDAAPAETKTEAAEETKAAASENAAETPADTTNAAPEEATQTPAETAPLTTEL